MLIPYRIYESKSRGVLTYFEPTINSTTRMWQAKVEKKNGYRYNYIYSEIVRAEAINNYDYLDENEIRKRGGERCLLMNYLIGQMNERVAACEGCWSGQAEAGKLYSNRRVLLASLGIPQDKAGYSWTKQMSKLSDQYCLEKHGQKTLISEVYELDSLKEEYLESPMYEGSIYHTRAVLAKIIYNFLYCSELDVTSTNIIDIIICTDLIDKSYWEAFSDQKGIAQKYEIPLETVEDFFSWTNSCIINIFTIALEFLEFRRHITVDNIIYSGIDNMTYHEKEKVMFMGKFNIRANSSILLKDKQVENNTDIKMSNDYVSFKQKFRQDLINKLLLRAETRHERSVRYFEKNTHDLNHLSKEGKGIPPWENLYRYYHDNYIDDCVRLGLFL